MAIMHLLVVIEVLKAVLYPTDPTAKLGLIGAG